MEIDVLLAGGIALRCGMESDFFAAGVLPGEEILEDRSSFWEQAAESGAVAGEDDGNFTPEEGEPFPLPFGEKERPASLTRGVFLLSFMTAGSWYSSALPW